VFVVPPEAPPWLGFPPEAPPSELLDEHAITESANAATNARFMIM
jgi:hypothetical protein